MSGPVERQSFSVRLRDDQSGEMGERRLRVEWLVADGAQVGDVDVGHALADPAQQGRGTDIYLDAAGAKPVVDTALSAAKKGATLGIVGVHKEPVPVELVNVMSNEITIVGSMGYPDEIFEVTKDLISNWQKYAIIVSHTIPFADVDEALRLASTPGAADKVVVTFT